MNGATNINDVYLDWFKHYLELHRRDSMIEPMSLEETNEEWQRNFVRNRGKR